ncbi:MAG: class I SAM-dependent methyltransferase [Pararhodobacter sp.]
MPARQACLIWGGGDGNLFLRLAADAGLKRLVGIDICAASLDRLRNNLKRQPIRAGKVEVRCALMTRAAPALASFDCAVLVETIEHIDPAHRLEWSRARFHAWGRCVAAKWHYGVRFRDIGGCHPDLGGASQMAVFSRHPESGPHGTND